MTGLIHAWTFIHKLKACLQKIIPPELESFTNEVSNEVSAILKIQ